jgi:hypothetical protein
MEKLIKKRPGRETAFYASDSRIWAEINYLDSPTDYREYLPGPEPVRNARTNGARRPSHDSGRPHPGRSYLLLLLICVFLLVLGLLVHLSGEW